jgi:peptidoglycan/LPS O-acetylase OafA/YrhL
MRNASNDIARADSLDVMRGFAALTVMFSHVVIVFRPASNMIFSRWSPASILVAGHQAVILFFVLSGFALACMINNMKPYSYPRYFFMRVLRLYPPYAFSIVFTLILFGILGNIGYQWEHGWMNVGKPYLTTSSAIQHALMVGVFGMADVSPVIWSLVYEMRLSILFPVIAWLVARFGFRAVIGFACFSVLYWLRYSKVPGSWPFTPTANLLETLHYATFFAAGCWIALNLPSIRTGFIQLNKNIRIAFIILAVTLYTYAFDGPQTFSQRALSDLVTGVGAMILLISSFDLPRNLAFRVGQWLGKVSYSLYLTHTAVLNICIIIFYNRFGALFTALSAVLISLLIASICQAIIERPSIHLSRAIMRRTMPHYVT